MTGLISAVEIEDAVKWRHDVHQHPELAFQEHRTSEFVAERLSAWGFMVKKGYGKTGLVGTMRKGTSRKSIGIRADMDALPITEETGAAYASKTPGAMHACGHDGHVSVALAAARATAKACFDGTVHFIFQPAEENEAGARFMIDDGLFRDNVIDAVYGMHNWPALPVGRLVARSDRMMAAFGTFEIIVTGCGAHGPCRMKGPIRSSPQPRSCAGSKP